MVLETLSNLQHADELLAAGLADQRRCVVPQRAEHSREEPLVSALSTAEAVPAAGQRVKSKENRGKRRRSEGAEAVRLVVVRRRGARTANTNGTVSTSTTAADGRTKGLPDEVNGVTREEAQRRHLPSHRLLNPADTLRQERDGEGLDGAVPASHEKMEAEGVR